MEDSLVVQWLGLCTSTAEGPAGSVPWSGTRISQAVQYGQKKRMLASAWYMEASGRTINSPLSHYLHIADLENMALWE